MPSSTRSERAVHDRGQAVIEAALALPLVCLALLGVVQVAAVVRAQLVVDHLAREAARAAAPAAAPASAAQASVAAAGVARTTVQVDVEAHRVRVTVRTAQPTDVPLIGLLVPDVVVEHSVVMQREPP
jgi:Flp pilus assembly protein TadG